MCARYPTRVKWGAGRRSGDRDEVVRDLEAAAEGWSHLGKLTLAQQAADGAEAIRYGATEAQVGHIVYEVADKHRE